MPIIFLGASLKVEHPERTTALTIKRNIFFIVDAL
jgi:hypothetical protein